MIYNIDRWIDKANYVKCYSLKEDSTYNYTLVRRNNVGSNSSFINAEYTGFNDMTGKEVFMFDFVKVLNSGNVYMMVKHSDNNTTSFVGLRCGFKNLICENIENLKFQIIGNNFQMTKKELDSKIINNNNTPVVGESIMIPPSDDNYGGYSNVRDVIMTNWGGKPTLTVKCEDSYSQYNWDMLSQDQKRLDKDYPSRARLD